MTLYRERIVGSARKQHKCEGCLQKIGLSESYLRITSLWDDNKVRGSAYHQDCRDWEVFLCQEADLMHDEWTPLYDHVAEGGLDVLHGAPQAVKDRFLVLDAEL